MPQKKKQKIIQDPRIRRQTNILKTFGLNHLLSIIAIVVIRRNNAIRQLEWAVIESRRLKILDNRVKRTSLLVEYHLKYGIPYQDGAFKKKVLKTATEKTKKKTAMAT